MAKAPASAPASCGSGGSAGTRGHGRAGTDHAGRGEAGIGGKPCGSVGGSSPGPGARGPWADAHDGRSGAAVVGERVSRPTGRACRVAGAGSPAQGPGAQVTPPVSSAVVGDSGPGGGPKRRKGDMGGHQSRLRSGMTLLRPGARRGGVRVRVGASSTVRRASGPAGRNGRTVCRCERGRQLGSGQLWTGSLAAECSRYRANIPCSAPDRLAPRPSSAWTAATCHDAPVRRLRQRCSITGR